MSKMGSFPCKIVTGLDTRKQWKTASVSYLWTFCENLMLFIFECLLPLNVQLLSLLLSELDIIKFVIMSLLTLNEIILKHLHVQVNVPSP